MKWRQTLGVLPSITVPSNHSRPAGGSPIPSLQPQVTPQEQAKKSTTDLNSPVQNCLKGKRTKDSATMTSQQWVPLIFVGARTATVASKPTNQRPEVQTPRHTDKIFWHGEQSKWGLFRQSDTQGNQITKAVRVQTGIGRQFCRTGPSFWFG